MDSKNIKLTFTYFFFLLFVSFKGNSQSTLSAAVDPKIAAVENNLCGPVNIIGQGSWNILDRMEHYKTKGVSIAVIDNYEVQWVKAYGFADDKEKTPATTSTRFQAASISKSINAIGIMQLVEKELLDLDADINTNLKSWQFPYNAKITAGPISTRQLLSHTGGLSTSGFNGYVKAKKLPSVTQILDGKKPANSDPVRSIAKPGEAFRYSGGGVTMTQLMVEDITGLSYADYIQKQVLEPLGMTQSFYGKDKNVKSSDLASGHWYSGNRMKNNYNTYPEQAAAGLWTTPTDLAKFIIELQKTLKGTSDELLNTASLKELTTPVLDNHSTALGFFIDDRAGAKYFEHSGSNEGFTCHYYGSMEGGKGLVVMTNSEAYHIIGEIINSITKTYEWENFYNNTPRKMIELEESELQPLLGTYTFESGNQITIAQERGTLYLSTEHTDRLDIHPESNRFFFMLYADEQVEFVEKDGKMELHFHRDGLVHVAERED